jgi:uncharacterized protein (DUF39 family)
MMKEELESMRQAMEDVKVQMADLKKNKKPVPVSRTNVWCTRCKKEGHHPDECKADWRMIQEAEASTEYGNQEQREIESVFAIQQQRYQQQRVPKIPGTCWTCGGLDHQSPECP